MKKFLALAIALTLLFAMVACGGDKDPVSEPESKAPVSESASSEPVSSEPASSEEPSVEPSEEPSDEPSEESSEAPEPKTYFNFLTNAKSVAINGTVTAEAIVVFTTTEAAAKGNCKWSTNVTLAKTETANVYEVISSVPGTGNDYAGTLEENQILIAVHSDGEGQNNVGKEAAGKLKAGDLISVVGIEEGNIILLKEYEETDDLVYKEPLPDYLKYQCVYYGDNYVYAVKTTDKTVINLTKIDAAPEAGDVILYTGEYGFTIGENGGDFTDFAILVVEYTHITTDGVNNFRYHKKAVYGVDDSTNKSNIEIPDDGYVVAIHKNQTDMITRLGEIDDNDLIYALGVQTKKIEWEVKKLEDDITIDGDFDDAWENYLIEEIDYDNVNWDYSQFELNNYGRSAAIYATYTEEGLMFSIVINSDTCVWLPDISEATKGSMYSYESLQFNVIDQSPFTDYMVQHTQYANDQTASAEDHVRQYGFCGSADGTAYTAVYMTGGSHATFTGELAVKRNDTEETTVYELFLPWAEINIDPEEAVEGFEFSFSWSINSSVEASTWKNIKMREGGGIITMNDFSKMPLVTLG